MASLEQINRMDENAYRVPDKMHKSKGGRKPLGYVTNPSKPPGKDKSPNGFKVKQKVRTPIKAVRKPLRDLSNLNNRLNEKSSKNSKIEAEKQSHNKCIEAENLCAVSENLEVENWGFGEGFLHNHNKCIEAEKQSMSMSMDYFLETAGLKKDSTLLEFPKLSSETKSEFEIGELEMMDEFPLTPPREPMSPPTLKSHESSCWELDWLDKFKIEVMESPPRN